VYFTVPSVEAQQGDAANYDQAETLCFYTETVPGILKSTSGSAPKQIRMRLGERYFFNDFTIDVMFTPDILPYQEWERDNRHAPKYVLRLLEYYIRMEKMTKDEGQKYGRNNGVDDHR